MAKNKVNQEQIDEFANKIRKDDGKLNLSDLKKLNSVYKREYINMVVEEDKTVQAYMK